METLDEKTATDAVAVVKNLKVVDARTYELMANGVLLLRKAKKFFEERAKPRIEEAWQHHKNLVADLKTDLAPIEEAQKYGDWQLSAYDQEQERIARAEQARLEAEKRKRDDEEKLQLAALAEQAGQKELANQILETPNTEPSPVVQKAVPKVDGLTFREDWKFEVTNWKEVPALYHRMMQNAKGEWHCHVMQDIGADVSRLKQTANIPGVRVYMVKTPVGRG
jgi:hypothetical protein